MNPTKQQVEEAAKGYEIKLPVNEPEGGLYFPFQIRDSFIAGAEYAMSFKPDVSKDFDDWIASLLRKTKSESEGRELIAMRDDLLKAWNACQAMMQKEIDHLKDINFELSQNLLCAQDQNHYFKLMCEYRDKLHDAEKKIEELQKSKNRGNVDSSSSSF
jgi:hypothetical protein